METSTAGRGLHTASDCRADTRAWRRLWAHSARLAVFLLSLRIELYPKVMMRDFSKRSWPGRKSRSHIRPFVAHVPNALPLRPCTAHTLELSAAILHLIDDAYSISGEAWECKTVSQLNVSSHAHSPLFFSALFFKAVVGKVIVPI